MDGFFGYLKLGFEFVYEMCLGLHFNCFAVLIMLIKLLLIKLKTLLGEHVRLDCELVSF